MDEKRSTLFESLYLNVTKIYEFGAKELFLYALTTDSELVLNLFENPLKWYDVKCLVNQLKKR